MKTKQGRGLSSTNNIAVAREKHVATVPDAQEQGGREWLH